MRRLATAGCFLAAALGGGCRSQSSAPGAAEHPGEVLDPFLMDAARPVPGAAPAAPPRSSAPPAGTVIRATVHLLDAGRAPRRKLRYAWRQGRAETLSIDLRTTAATESEGEHPPDVALPSVRVVVAIEPRAVSPAGDLTYAWHVTSTKVIPAPGSNPQLAEGMEHEVAAVVRLAGAAEVAPDGLAKEVTVDPGSVADLRDAGATGEMVDQIRQTITDLETPLPDDAVGVGARWEKVARLAARSAVVTQSETFTLASMSGDRGAVDDVLAQTAPPQDFPTAAAAGGSGTPAHLDSMLATGTAKARFDLTRIVPVTRYAGTTTMVVSGAPGADATRRVTMTLRVDIALSGSPP